MTTTVPSGSAAGSSAASRDFPMPGSPATVTTTHACSRRACAWAWNTTSSSSRRPTSGRSSCRLIAGASSESRSTRTDPSSSRSPSPACSTSRQVDGAACTPTWPRASASASFTGRPNTSAPPAPPDATTTPVLIPTARTPRSAAARLGHELERCPDGAERIVLPGDRDPECEERAVGAQIAHGSAVASADGRDRGVVPGHRRAGVPRDRAPEARRQRRGRRRRR